MPPLTIRYRHSLTGRRMATDRFGKGRCTWGRAVARLSGSNRSRESRVRG